MDPEGSWPDHKLWEALAAVQLKEAVVKVSCQLEQNAHVPQHDKEPNWQHACRWAGSMQRWRKVETT